MSEQNNHEWHVSDGSISCRHCGVITTKFRPIFDKLPCVFPNEYFLNLDEFISQISQIPGEDGWWNKSGELGFVHTGITLMSVGVPGMMVLGILDDLFWTVSGEYGN